MIWPSILVGLGVFVFGFIIENAIMPAILTGLTLMEAAEVGRSLYVAAVIASSAYMLYHKPAENKRTVSPKDNESLPPRQDKGTV